MRRFPIRPVNVRFAQNLSQGLTIRLESDTLEELRSRARRQGIGPTTLACMWIVDRLRRELD
ncbi:MAG: hypothetical protein DLM70_05795 [Chloroflexi bacterium]|nr:MAG: hypothetical protein DLM70_05795 [Chloroflexota bacterium]